MLCGWTAGTDEKAIIKVLAHRSCEQRQAIKLKFKSMYGRVRNPEKPCFALHLLFNVPVYCMPRIAILCKYTD